MAAIRTISSFDMSRGSADSFKQCLGKAAYVGNLPDQQKNTSLEALVTYLSLSPSIATVTLIIRKVIKMRSLG
jgi:hypothetical protein